MAWTEQQIAQSQKEGRVAEASRMVEQNAAEKLAAVPKKSAIQTTTENIKEGQKLGKDLVPDEILGNLSTEVGNVGGRLDEGRSADVQQVIEERRKRLGGLSKEEMSAQSGQAAEAMGRNEETNRRRLAGVQASLGVRGNTAGQQQGNLLAAGQQQRTNYERDLLLANRQIQDQALGAFEASVRGAEGSEQAARAGNIQVEQFNLGQQLKQRELEKYNLELRAKERYGQVAIAMGVAQLASAETASERAAAAQISAAAAAGSGGK